MNDMFVRTVKARGEIYVRLVETYREKGNPKPKQRVMANLGNLKLQRNNLIKIIYGLKKMARLDLYSPEEINHEEGLEYGSVLVAKKLDEEVGLKKMIENYFTRQKSKKIREIYTRVMI